MTTAAAGGEGPMLVFKNKVAVRQPQVALGVAAGVAAVYAFWEMRVRASRKLRLIPKTVEGDWQRAQEERMRHTPFLDSNPHKFAYLNPFRHNVPYSKAVWTE